MRGVSSFDHLVGEREQPIGDFETERLSGLDIDYQLVLGRHLHRQVGRFLAPEDTIDVAGSATQLIDSAGAVADQAAIFDEESERIDGRQPVARRKPDNQFAMNEGQAARQNNKSAVRGAAEIGNCTLDLADIAKVDWTCFY